MLWLLPSIAQAQDVITTTKGDDIQGRVFKITKKSIKYKEPGITDTSAGVQHTIPKKEVFRVTYESGVKETFSESHIDDKDPEGHWDKRSMSDQGKEDAQEYYTRYKGAKTGAYIGSFLGGAIIGLIPTLIIAGTPPKDRRLGYPDKELMENDRYRRAYIKEAHHIKRKKVWGGYGLGAATLAAVGVIVLVL